MRLVRRVDINPITKHPYHTLYNCSYFLYLVTNPVIDVIQFSQGKNETTIKVNENRNLAQFKINVNEYFDLSIDDLSSELNDDLNATLLQFDLLNQFNTGLNYAKGLFYFDFATGIIRHKHFQKISEQISYQGIKAVEQDYDHHFEVMQYFIERALSYDNILIQSLLLRENTKEHPIRFYFNESKKILKSFHVKKISELTLNGEPIIDEDDLSTHVKLSSLLVGTKPEGPIQLSETCKANYFYYLIFKLKEFFIINFKPIEIQKNRSILMAKVAFNAKKYGTMCSKWRKGTEFPPDKIKSQIDHFVAQLKSNQR